MAKPWRLTGDAPIEITRDAHGVLNIKAATEPDLYRGIGYAQGRDRALQLLLGRILGQGRVCELLSDKGESLEIDRAFRRWGFHVGAEAETDKLPPEARALMDAYCAGINQALSERVPWELRMLGYRNPEPWTIGDSVLWSRVMGHFGLSQTQESMERMALDLLKARLDPALLEALLPGRLEGLDLDLVRRVHYDETVLPDLGELAPPMGTGSNNWVVAGHKTASGKPMLGSDPHLEINRLPCIWQELVLHGPGGTAMGATVPGLPGLVIGRTERVAWGITYAYQDGTDSWVEEVRDGKYRRDEKGHSTWHDFEERTEIIRRKKHDDVTITVHENHHGVLPSDLHDGFLLATRWAPARDTGAASLLASLEVLKAQDAETALAYLGRVETAWNWVAADVDGHIGYQMSGKAPKRRSGVTGFVPVAGWDPENDWDGFHEPKDLPRCMDPEQGFFATANNDLVRFGNAPVQNLTMGDYRVRRIEERLEERNDWNVEAMRLLQTDNRSLQARRFSAIFGPLVPDNPSGRRLAAWRGHYRSESRGAALFEAFYRRLILDVLGRHIGEDAARRLLDETGLVAGFHRLLDDTLVDPESPWYGDEGRDGTWRRLLTDVCSGTAPKLAKTWRFRMGHILFGSRLPRLSVGPVSLAGGRATILQFQAFRVGGRKTTFGPSYRFVADLAEKGAHTILAGGPSDRPFSTLYASEVEDWVAGRLKKLGK